MSNVICHAWSQAESSTIDGFGLENGSDKLVIRFKNKSGGSVYRYNTNAQQSRSVFNALVTAESVGRAFGGIKDTLDDFEALGQALIVEPTGEEVPYNSSMKVDGVTRTSPPAPGFKDRLDDFLASLGQQTGGNTQTAYF